MKTFSINKKEFNLATDWSELTLRQYLSLVKTKEKESTYPIPTLFMIAVFEILCGAQSGELDDMELETLGVLTKELEFINKTPKFSKLESINIDGVDYIFPSDLSKTKLNEVITIQSIRQKIEGVDFIPYLLAVLLRPGKKVYDNELQKDVWVQDRFDGKNYEYRVNLFLDKCKGVDVMSIADFFLTGKTPQVKALKGSTKPKSKTQV